MSITLVTILTLSWLLLGFIGWIIMAIHLNKKYHGRYLIEKSDVSDIILSIGGPVTLFITLSVVISEIIMNRLPDVIWEYKPKTKK